MKSIWKRKWVIVIGAVAIFLSVGAAAWAAAAGDDPLTTATAGTTPTAAAANDAPFGGPVIAGLLNELGDGSGTPAERASAVMKRMRQKVEKFAQRQAALMNKLREDMSPADQALYDQLVETAKQQREALKEARQNLAETLKHMRDLRNKYLDTTTSTST